MAKFKVKRRQPTFDDLLSIHPLPPQLAGQEAELRNNPYVQHILEVTNACVEHGMNRAGIERAVTTALEFHAIDQHRCACCFEWERNPKPCGMFVDAKFFMLAFCRQCEKLINQDRATTEMQKNLKAYTAAEGIIQ